MKARGLGVASFCLLLFAQHTLGQSCDRYYMAVFASQRPGLNWPKYAHSFALFARVTSAPAESTPHVETVVISWLPRTQDVVVLTPRSEPGHNYDLESSICLAQSLDARISLWGPYEIRGDLYEMAVAQRDRLESGSVRYKALDMGYPADRVTNCIRAVGQVVPGGPKLCVGAPSWGDAASFFLTLAFRPYILDERQTHDEILHSLSLPPCTLVRRGLDHNPCEIPILRAVQDLRNRALMHHRR